MSAAQDKKNLHVLGLVVTVGLHLAVILIFYGAALFDSNRAARRTDENKLVPIEAGLAVRAKNKSGKKTRQPQKQFEQKVAPPDAMKIAADADVKPVDDAKKPEQPPRPEDVDFDAIARKHREGSTGQEVPASENPGGDDETKAGRVDGSDYGTLDQAKGDPYLGELVGRMTEHFEVPSTVEEGKGLRTFGCVKLNPDGSIAEAFLDPDGKSGNAAFNSAVLRSVKEASGMEQPVPAHLKQMLVEQGACATFKH
jgi:hypothetical protein